MADTFNLRSTGLTFTLFVNCDRCYVKGDLGLAGHLEVGEAVILHDVSHFYNRT